MKDNTTSYANGWYLGYLNKKADIGSNKMVMPAPTPEKPPVPLTPKGKTAVPAPIKAPTAENPDADTENPEQGE